MNEGEELTILVCALGLGGVLGIAYSLDARRKVRGPLGPSFPRPGPVAQTLLWSARVMIVLVLALIAGAYIFHAPLLAWLASAGVILLVIGRVVYAIARMTGK